MKDTQSFVKISFLVTFYIFKRNTLIFLVQPKNFSQFWRINSKIYGFFPYVFKKLQFFLFFNNDYTFYTKNLFFTTKDVQSIVKIRFLVTCLHL